MKKIKVLVAFLFVSLLVLSLHHALFKTDFARIKEIQISGAEPETQARIRQILDSQKAFNSPETGIAAPRFWDVKAEAIATLIQKDPWVETVNIKKIFPDQIQINITERTPTALVAVGNNSFRFIDKDGNIFGPAENKEVSRHVVISGKNLIENKDLRHQGLTLIQLLPDAGTISREDVSEVQYNSDKGFQIVLAKTGMVVDLGKENLPLHVDRARKVVQYLDRHQISATHVDADYAKKVLVKVRKGR